VYVLVSETDGRNTNERFSIKQKHS